MIRPQAVVSSNPMQAAAAVRELGRAFSHISDFQGFMEILESALNKAGAFERLQIVLPGQESSAELFASNHVTVPLAGRLSGQGALKVAPPTINRVFGPEDLHLVASFAAVVGTIVEHARHHGQVKRNAELLSLLLNLAPVGLLAIDAQGIPILINNQASRWLGLEAAPIAKMIERLKPENLGADWRNQSRFHLRLDGKLIYGEAVSVPAAPGESTGATTLVLVDLTPDQSRFIDGLQRELYRCRWLNRPLSFVLLESKILAGGLLQRMPDLRVNLLPAESVGPYDAFRVGMILPEMDRAGAVARIRSLLPLLKTDDLQASVITTSSDTSAEEVLGAALGNMQPYSDMLRRSLLLHDDYPAVNDMLALVLGRSYDVVKSSRIEDSMALLRSRPFDGLVTEVELRAGGSGLELARLAKQLHPSLRPFFTTVAHSAEVATDDPLLADHVVIRKPFDVRQLEETIREALP